MKEYDKELLKSMVEQKKTNGEIADRLGLSIGQVQYRVQQQGLLGVRPDGGYHQPTQRKPKKSEKKPISNGTNGDRKKCKTCKWRARYPVSHCNFGAFHKHSRSHYCTADNCTVYEKGKPMRENTE